MDVSEDDIDFENDFIRKPKFFHSTPRLPSIPKVNHTTQPSVNPIENESSVKIEPPVEYLNPFTPEGKTIAAKVKAQKKFKKLSISEPANKQNDSARPSFDGDTTSNCEPSPEIPKRPRLRDLNVSRFNEEFIVIEEIGHGEHGCVYKCLNRMNGCIYAVKRILIPVNSYFQEQKVRNEIYAHGILSHPNVVCNFSSWIEDGHAFIQNEYCDLGSLEEYIQDHILTEYQLRSLLLQMAQALQYIHSKGLAHVDIKPSNILVTSSLIENEDDSGLGENTDDLTFKIGDFGHISHLDGEEDIEEGDCRYLPREVLEGNLKHLDKGDIFSLGLSIYEASGGGPLPKNGEEWQEIRNGKLKILDSISPEFNDILSTMVDPQQEKRPSASNLVKMLQISQSLPCNSEGHYDHSDHDYLYQYYQKKARLEHKVETNGFFIRELIKSHHQLHDQLGMDSSGYYSRDNLSFSGNRNNGSNRSRIVGKKTKRSNSTMF